MTSNCIILASQFFRPTTVEYYRKQIMKEKNKIDFYINIGFSIFIFVLTLNFLKEYVFQSSSTLVTVLSGLIGGIFGFVLVWFLKNKRVVIKVFSLLVYIGFIAVSANYKKANIININSIKGNWINKKDSLNLTLEINETNMKMLFYPNNKEYDFDYDEQSQTIDFYNDMECDYFRWKILKLTNDSLIVLEKEQTIRFIKTDDKIKNK
jgi:hypothetical protein